MLLRDNGGLLLIRSGYGMARRGSEETDEATDERFPGTLVCMRVATDRPLDIQAVYRQLDQLAPNRDPEDDDDIDVG